MDKVTIERIKLLHPALRDEALQIYNAICVALTGRAICRFPYTLRTFAEQDKLYAQGRTAPGKKVTNAKAGQSYHNYGLAIDICLLKDTDGNGSYDTASWETNADYDGDNSPDWMEIVKIFKSYGWEWGGDWKSSLKDLPHFEKTFGKSVAQLHALYWNRTTVDDHNYVKL
jgi:peptidoglycan L-alanyl-D-glutamate endopeptidase CwlK